jgi:hypothetical protein
LYLNIPSAAAGVTIRRVHFKNGRSVSGAAICHLDSGNSSKTLTLESCIFSGNQSNVGGAIVSWGGKVIILGCTFYNNSAERSGAINLQNGSIRLTGNIFYGNTADPYDNVLTTNSGTDGASSLGYSVSDMASGGYSTTTGSGFDFATGDIQVTAATVDAATFKPLDSTALATLQIIPVPITIEGFPATDFYGNDRSVNSSGGYTAAGAVSVQQ